MNNLHSKKGVNPNKNKRGERERSSSKRSIIQKVFV